MIAAAIAGAGYGVQPVQRTTPLLVPIHPRHAVCIGLEGLRCRHRALHSKPVSISKPQGARVGCCCCRAETVGSPLLLQPQPAAATAGGPN